MLRNCVQSFLMFTYFVLLYLKTFCKLFYDIHIYKPSARAGYDTRSISKRSLTGFSSEFSFCYISHLTKAEELSLPYYLSIAGGRMIELISFPRVLVLCEMPSVSFRIWTRVAVSISYDIKYFTTNYCTQLYHHHHQVALTAGISLRLTLSIRPYNPSLLVGLPNYILCPYRTDTNKFLLVGQHWNVHVLGSIEERHLWVRPCFSNGVLHVLFGFWDRR